MPARLVSLSVAVTLVLSVACADDDGVAAPGDDPSLAYNYDAGFGNEDCPPEAHVLTYGDDGLLADNDNDVAIQVRVTHANHVPPSLTDLNAWTFELQDRDGGTRTDYEVTWVCTFMKQHGHTGPTLVQAGDKEGEYALPRLKLPMSGGWDIRIWVDPVDPERAPFTWATATDRSFCVPSFDITRTWDLAFRFCVPE